MTAIWFDMWPTDAKNRWDPDLISDHRVTHYWDPDREIGSWFGEHKELIGFDYNKGPTVWDSFFLFGGDAFWDTFPTPLISYGNTVLADKDMLFQATKTYFDS